jgi:hypothetical protein
VITAQATSATTSGDGPRRADASSVGPAPGVSNKPMVPTAHDWPNDNPLHPLRRHIGRPLDSLGPAASGARTGSERRAAFGASGAD